MPERLTSTQHMCICVYMYVCMYVCMLLVEGIADLRGYWALFVHRSCPFRARSWRQAARKKQLGVSDALSKWSSEFYTSQRLEP